MRLHRLALEALEAVYGEEAGPHLAELAHHAIAGSDFDKGLRYARRAAGHALALLAYEEAARLFVTALDALELASVQDDETRCQLLLSLGEAQIYAGNTQAGKEVFLEAAAVARRLGLHRELALAAGGYAREDMYLRAGSDGNWRRCSKKDWPRSATRRSSFERGFSPGSRERFATSCRETVATGSAARRSRSPAVPETSLRSRTPSTAAFR